MRDDQDGFVGQQLPQRQDQLLLVFRVDARRCFVEDDDLTRLQHGAGDGDALPFAAGQIGPSLLEDRVIAVRQFHDELVAPRFLRDRDNFFIGRVRFPELDIVPDRVVEKVDVLEDEGEIRKQFVISIIPDVDAADLDFAAVDVPESRDQAAKRRFSASGAADDRRRPVRRNRQVHIPEKRFFFIRKINVFYLDFRVAHHVRRALGNNGKVPKPGNRFEVLDGDAFHVLHAPGHFESGEDDKAGNKKHDRFRRGHFSGAIAQDRRENYRAASQLENRQLAESGGQNGFLYVEEALPAFGNTPVQFRKHFLPLAEGLDDADPFDVFERVRV